MRERRVSTGVDDGKTPPSPFPTLHPRIKPPAAVRTPSGERPGSTAPAPPAAPQASAGTVPPPATPPVEPPTPVPANTVDGTWSFTPPEDAAAAGDAGRDAGRDSRGAGERREQPQRPHSGTPGTSGVSNPQGIREGAGQPPRRQERYEDVPPSPQPQRPSSPRRPPSAQRPQAAPKPPVAPVIPPRPAGAPVAAAPVAPPRPAAAPPVPPRPAAQPLPAEAPRPATPPVPPAAPAAPVPPPRRPVPRPTVAAPPVPPAPPAPAPPETPYTGPTPPADVPSYPTAPTVPEAAGRGRRRVAAAVCLVVGLGLVGGAVAGAVINNGPQAAQPPADGSPAAFATARDVWRDTPVDRLFPPTVSAKNAGPGGADRSWTRIGVSAPSSCAGAFDPLLQQVMAPVGCVKLLRATYVDSTSTTVTTVGTVVTSGEAAAMSALNRRWTTQHLGERADLLPRPVAFPGTAAAGFGVHQRGSWDVQVSADLPFVVYAVSGFADGRTVPAPQPADKADADGATTAAAQVGLGFDATGLASAVDDRLHAAVTTLLHPPTDGTEKR